MWFYCDSFFGWHFNNFMINRNLPYSTYGINLKERENGWYVFVPAMCYKVNSLQSWAYARYGTPFIIKNMFRGMYSLPAQEKLEIKLWLDYRSVMHGGFIRGIIRSSGVLYELIAGWWGSNLSHVGPNSVVLYFSAVCLPGCHPDHGFCDKPSECQ